jgi:thymidine kinase
MSNKLYFKFGCMNSAKSMLLLTTAHNLEENGLEIMVLKPSADTRDGEGIIRSRVGIERKCISVDDDINIYRMVKEYRNFLASQFIELKWILVDECQFLTEQQVDQLSDVVDLLGISVICYGLRTDFQSKLFPASKRLFEITDDLEEIKSTCACGESKTSINARFDENGKIVTEGDQVVIGGNDMYKPLCRKCWKNKIRDKKLAENGEQ